MRYWFVSILIVGSIILNSCTSTTTKQDTAQRIERVDSSLVEIYNMFNRGGTTMNQPDVIMIIFILRQHFELTFPFPSLTSFLEKRPYLMDRYFKLYNEYFDGKHFVHYSDEDVNAYLDQSLGKDLNAMTFWSMYCFKFPLDDRFLSNIKEKVLNPPVYPDLTNTSTPPPEYWSLHAALQIVNARTNGCLPNSTELEAVEEEVVRNVKEIAQGNITTTQYDLDIRTEAYAMLYYLGLDDEISDAQIDELLSHQLKGGGWSYSTGSENASLHTTVLAMWVLLEYKESLQGS